MSWEETPWLDMYIPCSGKTCNKCELQRACLRALSLTDILRKLGISV